jgi:hypothetical protein
MKILIAIGACALLSACAPAMLGAVAASGALALEAARTAPEVACAIARTRVNLGASRTLADECRE